MALENEGVTAESRDRLHMMQRAKRNHFRWAPCVSHKIRHTNNEHSFKGEGKRAHTFTWIQGQHFTRDAVVVRVQRAVIINPAIGDVVARQIIVVVDQALRPVRVRIQKIAVGLRRAAKGFVRIGEIIRKGAQR